METPKITVTRKLWWHSGHRLVHHAGACKAHHGHEYVAHIECRAGSLDALGRVIDFGVIKSEVKAWIDKHWDHTCIFHAQDDARSTMAIREDNAGMDRPCYLLPANPTAENIALELLHVSEHLLAPHGVEVCKVTVHETSNCSACVERPDDFKPMPVGWSDVGTRVCGAKHESAMYSDLACRLQKGHRGAHIGIGGKLSYSWEAADSDVFAFSEYHPVSR